MDDLRPSNAIEHLELDLDPLRPFTRSTALCSDLTPSMLSELVHSHAVRRVLRGVNVAAAVPDTLALRAAALRLVVPERAVVVDETAGWLHGANMILAPTRTAEVPRVHVFHREPGCRLRNDMVASGERGLLERDVDRVDGISVTTPLRTATDLGRLRYRDQALAALDSLLRLETFDVDDLLRETGRFRGFRGVVQLRALAPLADPRSESPAESALRLRWIDARLPAPVPQYTVSGPYGQAWRLDLADPASGFAAEYDGERHHTARLDTQRDDERREYITAVLGWVLVVVRRNNVYGQLQDAELLLRSGYSEALARHF